MRQIVLNVHCRPATLDEFIEENARKGKFFLEGYLNFDWGFRPEKVTAEVDRCESPPKVVLRMTIPEAFSSDIVWGITRQAVNLIQEVPLFVGVEKVTAQQVADEPIFGFELVPDLKTEGTA